MVDVMKLDIHKIKPNNYNPNSMDDFEYQTLVRHIREYGMLQPILVRRDGEKLVIVDGFHRWKASKEAGLTDIWGVVVESSEELAKVRTISFNTIRGSNDRELLGSLFDELSNYFSVDELSMETGFRFEELKEIFVFNELDTSLFDVEKDEEVKKEDKATDKVEKEEKGIKDVLTIGSIFGNTSINLEYVERIHGLCDNVGVDNPDNVYKYTQKIAYAVGYGIEDIDVEDVKRLLEKIRGK